MSPQEQQFFRVFIPCKPRSANCEVFCIFKLDLVCRLLSFRRRALESLLDPLPVMVLLRIHQTDREKWLRGLDLNQRPSGYEFDGHFIAEG